VRILVDQSGYALLNIGDIAMLQACVRRLRTLWPNADIQVFAQSPTRLRRFCPGTSEIAPTILGRRCSSILPKSSQLAAEQMWKTAIPLLARPNRSSSIGGNSARPRLLEAVRRADLVVSSGGGFVNDVFWWHGAGVLSVLAMAQRLGKPTAMFGQGIGPLTHPLLSRLASRTMPRLMVIGLREGLTSVPVLQTHRVGQERIQVTGDDGLVLATRETRPRTGTGIGLNVRVASYSGIAPGVGRRVIDVVRREACRRDVPSVALPVEHNTAASDLQALGDREIADIQTPEELANRVARCRVVVTGSYHAAVFGLAAGIPAICISNSAYYDSKFAGLAALFPGGCQIVRHGPALERDLINAIARAWETSEASRDDIHAAALAQVAKADRLYERFKSLAAPGVKVAFAGAGADEPKVGDQP
jgi:polysaccharide pyruvyl transferase WcaK-like protein